MTIDPRYRGTTFGGFEESCRKYPDRTAIVYLGERFSYAELGRLVDRFAAGLLEIGVKPKGKVLLYLRNCPQWVIANYAINKIGAVVVPVSPIYTSHELEYIVNDAEVETVICLDTNFMYVREVIARTDLKRVIVTGLADLLPPWKRAFGYLFDKIPVGKVERSGEVISFKEVLAEEQGAPSGARDQSRGGPRLYHVHRRDDGLPEGRRREPQRRSLLHPGHERRRVPGVPGGGADHDPDGQSPVPHHGQGVRDRDGVQQGEHAGPDADPGARRHPRRDPEVPGDLDAGRSVPVPDPPRERPDRPVRPALPPVLLLRRRRAAGGRPEQLGGALRRADLPGVRLHRGGARDVQPSRQETVPEDGGEAPPVAEVRHHRSRIDGAGPAGRDRRARGHFRVTR